jgi:hypothetical protein
MKVRLTRKFADSINGVDLSKAEAGETLDLSTRDANILLAEGWAEYAGGSPAFDKADEHARPKRMPRSAK